MILFLSSDLIFRQKVREVASAVDAPVEFFRSVDALLARVEQGGVTRLLVDLSLSGLDVLDLRGKVRELECIGFASHVDVGRMESARSAGFSQVMPRSRFVSILPDLLVS